MNYREPLNTGYLGATVIPHLWTWSCGYHFLKKAEVFLHEISFAEKCKVRGIQEGSPKWVRQFFPALPFVFFQIAIGILMVNTYSDFQNKFEIQTSLTVTYFFLIYTFAWFHDGYPKNTLILTFFRFIRKTKDIFG